MNTWIHDPIKKLKKLQNEIVDISMLKDRLDFSNEQKYIILETLNRFMTL